MDPVTGCADSASGTTQLDVGIAAMESGDKQALAEWLDRAAQRRKALHQKKMRDGSGE